MGPYTTLQRYDDSSLRLRARCTNDIRQRERESLNRSRTRKRCILSLRNRNILAPSEHSYASPDSGIAHSNETSSPSPPPSDSGWASESWIFTPRSDAPSPSLSLISEQSIYSSGHDDADSLNGDSIFLNSIIDDMFQQEDLRKARQGTLSRRNLLKLRKQSHLNSFNLNKTRREFDSLKKIVKENCDKPQSTGNIVASSWNILDNAMRSPDQDLSKEVVEFIRGLVDRRSIDSDVIVFLLQNGLIFTIRDSMSRFGDLQLSVLELFTSIAQADPRIVPFLIDLLINTSLLSKIDESLDMGTYEEVHMSLQFYCLLFNMTIQNYTSSHPICPLLPQILIATTAIDQLSNAYSPPVLLKRLIRPSLLDPIMRKFLRQSSHFEKDSKQLALHLMSITLNYLAHEVSTSNTDQEWVYKIISKSDEASMGQVLTSSNLGGTNDCEESIQIIKAFQQLKTFVMFRFNSEVTPVCNAKSPSKSF